MPPPRIPCPAPDSPPLSADNLTHRIHQLLARHADPEGHVTAGQRDLAAHCHVAPISARAALWRLVASGDITLVRAGVKGSPAQWQVLREPRVAVPSVPKVGER